MPPPPLSSGTPDRPRTHSRNTSLSELVLNPDAAASADTTATTLNLLSNDNDPLLITEHHDALIGAEFKNPETISKQPTLATLGDTPFSASHSNSNVDNSNTIEHHRVVATEFVDPVKFEEPEPILQNVLVLLAPNIPNCLHLIEAGKKRGLMIMAVVPVPSDGSRIMAFHPTAEAVRTKTHKCALTF